MKTCAICKTKDVLKHKMKVRMDLVSITHNVNYILCDSCADRIVKAIVREKNILMKELE